MNTILLPVVLTLVFVGLASCAPFNENLDYIDDTSEEDDEDGWGKVMMLRGDGKENGGYVDDEAAFINRIKKGWGFTEDDMKPKPNPQSNPQPASPRKEADQGVSHGGAPAGDAEEPEGEEE